MLPTRVRMIGVNRQPSYDDKQKSKSVSKENNLQEPEQDQQSDAPVMMDAAKGTFGLNQIEQTSKSADLDVMDI